MSDPELRGDPDLDPSEQSGYGFGLEPQAAQNPGFGANSEASAVSSVSSAKADVRALQKQEEENKSEEKSQQEDSNKNFGAAPLRSPPVAASSCRSGNGAKNEFMAWRRICKRQAKGNRSRLLALRGRPLLGALRGVR